jgi:hypothetical protein
MPGTGDDSLAGIAEELERLTSAARGGSLDGATWSRIAAAMGARSRQTAQKRHADLTRRRCPPTVDAPAAQPRPQAREAGHDRSIPPAKALVSEDALPKSTRQPTGSAGASYPVPAAREHASSGHAARRSPKAAGHPEDHRRHHRRGPLPASPGTGPRRDPRLARPSRRQARRTGPPHLARGTQPSRLGTRRCRRHRAARDRHRQGHRRRKRPHPRRRRSQPPAGAAAPAGERARESHPLIGCVLFRGSRTTAGAADAPAVEER